MRYRQIHLDFHTSDVIPDVGEDFDAADFVKALKDAHVNSINIFAKCHHGMCYYPTKAGRMHPSLKFDLLGTMISELHKADITCPVYFPLGWEEDSAKRTEWLEIGKDGIPGNKLPEEAGYYRWRKLCLNNKDYRKHIKDQIKELLDNYDVDGLWFDIVNQEMCKCPACLKEMKESGLDPDSETDVKKHDDMVLTDLQRDLNEYVHMLKPEATTVYNTGWVPDGGYDKDHTIENRSLLQDHIEIESLPSGEWGYLHFPLLVNFHNRNDQPIVGMNGKFHLSWGDHGSLKNQEALEFECFRMIANGCMVSVGDQLHPRGAMNHSAYKRIGKVYEKIEELEPYLEGSKKCADIGVVVAADFYKKNTVSDEGVLRMLMQLHYQFDLITISDDIGKYSLIILPDTVEINKEFDHKLEKYIAAGGRVIATYRSCLEAIGVEYISDNEYTPSYMIIDDKTCEELGMEIDPLEYVCYETGAYVRQSSKGEGLLVASYVGKPYFNRTCDCFSSHRHFPFERKTDYPAILMSDSIGYCAFPLFKDYAINGNRVYKEVIEGMIGKLMPEAVIRTDAPSYAEITVRRQTDSNGRILRYLIHILSYIPQRITRTIDIVNEPALLTDVRIGIRCGGDECSENAFNEVRCLLTDRILEYEKEDGYITFNVPEVKGYECIVVGTTTI